ncbi:MAG: hypothetical protein KGL44_00705 [Sphingomonadales bacterium]|nr:hypothetical protein [Sphingomonadales bacterium]
MQACPLLPEQATRLYAGLSAYEQAKQALLEQPWFDKDALRIYLCLALFAAFSRLFARRFASTAALAMIALVVFGIEAVDTAYLARGPTWSRAGWLGDTLSDLVNGLLLPVLLWLYARRHERRVGVVPAIPTN